MDDTEMVYKEKAKRLWWDFIWERRWVYLIGALSVFATNFLQVWAPKNIGWIIDNLQGKSVPRIFSEPTQAETFFTLFWVLCISRVAINLCRYAWRRTLGRQTHHSAAYLRFKVWESASLFSPDDFQTTFTKGALISASASDAMTARFVFGFTLVAVFDVIFLGLLCLGALLQIHWQIALLSFATLVLVPFFVKKISTKEMGQYKKTQEALSYFNDLCSQAVSTIKLQRLTQTGAFWERNLNQCSSDYRNNRLIGIDLNLLYVPLMGAAVVLSYILIFGFGIIYVRNQSISVGEFVAIQGLVFLLHEPLMSLGFLVSEWKRGMTALERLCEIYYHKPQSELLIQGQKIPESPVVLKIENLGFSYGQHSVLENIHLNIFRGERVGILGTIGAGKSTLLKLMSGLERNHRGSILFHGEEFSQFSHQDLRSKMALVSQKSFLFADTIRNNIQLDRKLTDEEIWNILDIVQLKQEISKLPKQLDTILGEWGINLSGGQKQRLSLARALSRECDVLFIDDGLSAVDTVNEELILKNLDKYFKEKTLVWVAHRESTLKYCDRVFELKQGEDLIGRMG